MGTLRLEHALDEDREGDAPLSQEERRAILARLHERTEAEVAVLVTDAAQRKGLGQELLGRLIGVARQEGIVRLLARILPTNLAMMTLARRFGFVTRPSTDPSEMTAVLELSAPPVGPAPRPGAPPPA